MTNADAMRYILSYYDSLRAKNTEQVAMRKCIAHIHALEIEEERIGDGQ